MQLPVWIKLLNRQKVFNARVYSRFGDKENLFGSVILDLAKDKFHPELELEDPEATVRIITGSLVYYVIGQEMLHTEDILPLESDRLVATLVGFVTRNVT